LKLDIPIAKFIIVKPSQLKNIPDRINEMIEQNFQIFFRGSFRLQKNTGKELINIININNSRLIVIYSFKVSGILLLL